MAEKMTLDDAMRAVAGRCANDESAWRAWLQLHAHLTQPAQAVGVGVISRAVEGWRVYEAGGYGLVAYHHEWGELRGDTRDKPAKQWALIATLRDVITATRALGNAQAEGWRPIETAPDVAGDFFFCRLAWGPEDDQCTGDGYRWRGRWFAAGFFHQSGQEKRLGFREIEVRPTHWQPKPDSPTPPQPEE